MTPEIAIAANRFGLGVRPDSPPSGKPANWLMSQIDRYDPKPEIIAAQPPIGELIMALQELRANSKEQREMRKAAGMEDKNAEIAEAQFTNYRKAVRDSYAEAVGARLQVAIGSENAFAERLVHFWANHFAVSIDKLTVVGVAGNYEFAAIRPHIFGKFGDLLKAAVRHPAMLLYLDQAQSIGPDSPLAKRVNARRETNEIGLNENLAREILELHTLGVRSVYSQEDVTEFARALTGWTFAGLARGPIARLRGDGKPGETVFVDAIHQPGTRKIAGRSYAQTGAAQAEAILSDLATYPATAKHIATKLATHFVSDSPPASLIAKLETDFLKTGGDLKSLYRTLLNAPEAWAIGQPKFKTPWEWTISALRALNIKEMPGRAQASVALLNQMGQPIWKPGSPAGFGDKAKDWAGPAALMRRVESAGRFAKLAANRVDARQLAPAILPGTLDRRTAEHIARAESPEQGLALLLVAPEFLRR